MHRWLNAFFALVMVLQFAWAAMGLHGANEMNAGLASSVSDFFTKALSSADAKSEAATVGLQEPLCTESSCHGHDLHAVTVCYPSLDLILAQSAAGTTAPAGLGDSHIPSGLDRPNWQGI